ELTALDGSPEMLALNAARLRSSQVQYIEADLFRWQPTDVFDTVFFSFWLSHVPPERFENFWKLVRSCLAPDGRVFFVDSRHEQTSTAVNHQLPEQTDTISRRKLNDDREYQIYKIFYKPTDLVSRLQKLGWRFTIEQTENYFIHGFGQLEQT
ncbi:MAG TPA: class I SAM-dependent methyltransferase, partial [Candidatus Binatia bacterium]|nr:class I SAM-dependent methyltransferase [Candidatus Binatia bacterium]